MFEPRILMVDVDGVIVHPRAGRHWSDGLEAELGLSAADLQSQYFSRFWPEVMLGRADLPATLAPVLARIAPHLPAEELIAYWFRADSRLDEELLTDLGALRRDGVRLHLATVQEHHRARYLWDTVGLRDHFEAIHYSADIGAAKPDPAFYDAVTRKLGVAPSQLLLIDDRAENVAGARASGWGGVLWDGSARIGDLLARPDSYFD